VREGEISTDDPTAADVRQLIERHLAFANQHSQPEDVYALGTARLAEPAIEFFGFRCDGKVLGIGALSGLDQHHAELKSMHTLEAVRGQGIGRAMVDHLLGVAYNRGFRQVSIETGTSAAFAPARSLYAKVGFEPCGAFSDYTESPNRAFMTMFLDRQPGEG
jgi:putative acetyltransferase